MSAPQTPMQASEQMEAQSLDLYLIHDTSLDPQAFSESVPEIPFTALPWSERDTPPNAARVLLCLGDEQIREIAHGHQFGLFGEM